jgi:lauroyl/myristoyl acyltransferase
MRARAIAAGAADRVYRSALESEAREEADSARFMRDRGAFERWLPDAPPPEIDGPVLYVSLHLGSPVLGFLYLRTRGRLDVRAMVRDLDPQNPMRDAKRSWGMRKLAWVREVAGGGILAADGAAVGVARDHLLAGGAVFAALDIPGDVVTRSAEVSFHGERVLFSSGIVRLAELTRSTIVPMVALGGAHRMRVHFAPVVDPGAVDDPFAAAFAPLLEFVDRFPGEWWMWPFLHPATAMDRAASLG